MTFWNPARTESLQAPPHWKCGGISNISHWQKDLTACVHAQARLLFSHLFIYLFPCLFLCPPPPTSPPFIRELPDWIKSTSNSKVLFYFFFTLSQTSSVEGGGKKKKQSVWLEISDSTAFPDIPLYVSNQQLNVNASLAPVGTIGAESVCVCLTPKCLKCPLSALLSSPPPLPSRLYSFFFPLTLLLLYMQKTQHQVCGSADWTHLLQTLASVPSPVR